jgi:hypothetical protein
MDKPTLRPFIVSNIFAALFGVATALLYFGISGNQAPDWYWGLTALAAWMFGLCLLVGLVSLLRWWYEWSVEVYYQKQQARALTPLSRAAEAVRQLTFEQQAIIPHYMGNDLGIAILGQENELTPYLWTEDGVHIPLDYIESFLLKSNNMYLQPINETSDKTPEREYAQAFTYWCIRRKYAVPSTGPHPAAWRYFGKQSGRETCAKFLHIRLRKGNGYYKPEEEPELEEEAV